MSERHTISCDVCEHQADMPCTQTGYARPTGWEHVDGDDFCPACTAAGAPDANRRLRAAQSRTEGLGDGR